MMQKLKVALRTNHVGAIFTAIVGGMGATELISLIVRVVGWKLATLSRGQNDLPGYPQQAQFDWTWAITQAISVLLYFAIGYFAIRWLYISNSKEPSTAPVETE